MITISMALLGFIVLLILGIVWVSAAGVGDFNFDPILRFLVVVIVLVIYGGIFLW